MLMNIMACHVFRKTKLGSFNDNTRMLVVPTMRAATSATGDREDSPHAMSPLSFQKFSSHGNLMRDAHNITIDLGTKELGVEHAPATGRPIQASPSLTDIDRKLGEDIN